MLIIKYSGRWIWNGKRTTQQHTSRAREKRLEYDSKKKNCLQIPSRWHQVCVSGGWDLIANTHIHTACVCARSCKIGVIYVQYVYEYLVTSLHATYIVFMCIDEIHNHCRLFFASFILMLVQLLLVFVVCSMFWLFILVGPNRNWLRVILCSAQCMVFILLSIFYLFAQCVSLSHSFC